MRARSRIWVGSKHASHWARYHPRLSGRRHGKPCEHARPGLWIVCSLYSFDSVSTRCCLMHIRSPWRQPASRLSFSAPDREGAACLRKVAKQRECPFQGRMPRMGNFLPHYFEKQQVLRATLLITCILTQATHHPLNEHACACTCRHIFPLHAASEGIGLGRHAAGLWLWGVLLPLLPPCPQCPCLSAP